MVANQALRSWLCDDVAPAPAKMVAAALLMQFVAATGSDAMSFNTDLAASVDVIPMDAGAVSWIDWRRSVSVVYTCEALEA